MNTLNEKQRQVLDLAINGRNLLISGNNAGVGKSFTLSEIVKESKRTFKKVAITAATGIAALLIGGITFHKFLGCGLFKLSPTEYFIRLKKFNKKHFLYLNSVKILIIDEISMIDGELIDKANEFLQLVRNCIKPFGGIQIILSGDLFQLSPINKLEKEKPWYFFESNFWRTLKPDITCIILDQQMRQTSEDQKEFVKILTKIRKGICDQEVLDFLESLRHTEFDENDKIKPTKLYSLCADVDVYNYKMQEELIEQGNESKIYRTKYSGDTRTEVEKSKKYASDMKIPSELKICIGDQVMVTRNLSESIVNGTKGVVVELLNGGVGLFLSNGVKVTIGYIENKNELDEDEKFEYIPLMLCYACTIHKIQGATINSPMIINLENSFAFAQAYVALSRSTRLEYIKIEGKIKPNMIFTNPDIEKFYEEL